ncbi:MAG: hypothetical protein KAH57_03965, partial [Thermoplasmata archaeon]|nr:hypothetical protein [Thermoplasmata archaeon]
MKALDRYLYSTGCLKHYMGNSHKVSHYLIILISLSFFIPSITLFPLKMADCEEYTSTVVSERGEGEFSVS